MYKFITVFEGKNENNNNTSYSTEYLGMRSINFLE